MKVRDKERELFNFVKKNQIVTCQSIIKKFGAGHAGMFSYFVPYAVSAANMNEEVRDALVTLRNNGSIFEIACGQRFHELVGGGVLEDSIVVKVTEEDLEKDWEEYEEKRKEVIEGGKSYWLPCIFVSDAGLKQIVKKLCTYNNVKPYEPIFSSILTNLHERLKDKDQANRLGIMGWYSYILTDLNSDLWDKAIDKLEEKYKNALDRKRKTEDIKQTYEKIQEKSLYVLNRETVINPDIMIRDLSDLEKCINTEEGITRRVLKEMKRD